jgi:peptidoglycan L-alanyl-D-glutamate endopeptidase CwlK
MEPSARDRQRLKGVHSDLLLLYERACEEFPKVFSATPSFQLFVIEGLRTRAKQLEYVQAGSSWTLNSRHLYGLAFDLGVQSGGKMRWEFPVYERLAKYCVMPAAKNLDLSVVWGGSWKSRDGPHFELVGPKYQLWMGEFNVRDR